MEELWLGCTGSSMECYHPNHKDRFLERPSMLNRTTTSQVWARLDVVCGGDQSSTRDGEGTMAGVIPVVPGEVW